MVLTEATQAKIIVPAGSYQHRWLSGIDLIFLIVLAEVKYTIDCSVILWMFWKLHTLIIDCLACKAIQSLESFGFWRHRQILARKKSVLAGKLKDVGYRQSWPALEKNILLSKFWQQKATLAEKLEDVSKRESWPMTHARRRFRGRKILADTSDVFCSLSLSRT